MKIVVTTCTHIGKRLAGYDWKNHLIAAFDDVIKLTRKADLFVHLGDVFDGGKPSPRDYALALEALDAIDCPMCILKGNHDENPGLEPDALEPLSFFRFQRDTKIVRGPCVLGVNGKLFGFIPFQNDSKAREISGNGAQGLIDGLLADMHESKYELDLDGEQKIISALFMHIDIRGYSYDVKDESERVNAAVDLLALKKMPFEVICGHYHNSASVVPNIYFPGSILPFDFGAVGLKRYAIILDV